MAECGWGWRVFWLKKKKRVKVLFKHDLLLCTIHIQFILNVETSYIRGIIKHKYYKINIKNLKGSGF